MSLLQMATTSLTTSTVKRMGDYIHRVVTKQRIKDTLFVAKNGLGYLILS